MEPKPKHLDICIPCGRFRTEGPILPDNRVIGGQGSTITSTVVSSEAWAKLCDWASAAGRGRLLLSGSVAHASLKTAVHTRKFSLIRFHFTCFQFHL